MQYLMLVRLLKEWCSWVYPFTCELCGRGGLDGVYLCPVCCKALERIEPPVCAVCGESAEGSFIPSGLCAACAAQPPSFAKARAVYTNDGPVKELILAFKYAGAIHLAGTFARIMAQAVEANSHWFGSESRLLVPVPMSRSKLIRRGYNQAGELAFLLGRELGWPCAGLLKRLSDGTSQASLDRESRARHARNAYALHEGHLRKKTVRGGNVLLVDDVITSGATANACSRLLLRAGAASVCVLTLARTPRLLRHG